MVKGVYKITAISAILPKEGKLGSNAVHIKFQLGPQTAISLSEGYEPKWDEVHLFEVITEEKLEVSIYQNENDQKYGYAQVLLTPLLKIPNTRHQITIHSIFRDKKFAIQDKESAVIQIEVYYTELFEARLQMKIIDGDLIRDTESVGKMDPYVVMKIGQQQRKTTAKNEAGRFPKWNQLLTIPVSKLSDSLEINVYDKDITIDDLIGNKIENMREGGYLKISDQFREKRIKIFFKDQEAGSIRVSIRFIFSLIKPK